MANFKDRERGEEKRFQLDQEQEFKAQARRARLVGEWAGSMMGLEGDELTDYAKSVVMADLEEAGEEDLFRKIRADIDAKGAAISDHQIRARMEEALTEARAQIKAQG
ncbi:MAG: DUF1476 domain-containing protein [Hyphomonadaceae bacterium]